ncbi:GNAT family N-acetyltransferase [Flavobacterium pectinovorum]|uniref:N-acetyltransferase n=1 Tax=Flavobacterium pectinovorum TaxID=29533 RepID=A0A502F6S3_9FLAO|nr:GNAT family N-acetyltransferase [Flavobacterium pectinovorum]TPG44701.1 N-acetyltransferase [Flavobacterium pectinovorum]
MKIVQKEVLSLEEKDSLMQLWNNEYPARLHLKTIDDFESYLNGISNTKHYLLLDDSNKINGWAFTFLREGEDWFAIILDSQIQGKGNGSLLINEIKKNNSSLNGWVTDHENEMKQNNEIYKSPMVFYLKNGFTILAETRLENEKMSAVKINWKR